MIGHDITRIAGAGAHLLEEAESPTASIRHCRFGTQEQRGEAIVKSWLPPACPR
jgi:hypothetical protein